MFETWSYETLQHYWWGLVALLAALFVFMSFVQGGQSLLRMLSASDDERDLLVNALGRKWELGFTTLVVFGGALFAAFPLFYAVSFGGAYYVWMAILFCFILQAVAYEYRKKPGNIFGQRTYEIFLFINGTLGIFLIGAALGTLFTGGHFVVNEMHLSHWTTPTYGLEALLVPFNVALGVMLVLLARVQGSLFFIASVADDTLRARARHRLKREAPLFLAAAVYVLYGLFTLSGYGIDAQGHIIIEPYKFFHNLVTMPAVAGVMAAGLLLLLTGIGLGAFTPRTRAFWWSSAGVVLLVSGMLMLLGFNRTAIYPSLDDPASSLTLANASASRYTLVAMSYVSLMVPFVVGYIAYVWRAMSKPPLSLDEIRQDPHHY